MVEMNYPKDLHTLVVDFFKHPPKDSCYDPNNNSNTDTSNNGDYNVIVVNDEKSNSNNYTLMTPNSMVNIVITHIIDSQVTNGCG